MSLHQQVPFYGERLKPLDVGMNGGSMLQLPDRAVVSSGELGGSTFTFLRTHMLSFFLFLERFVDILLPDSIARSVLAP